MWWPIFVISAQGRARDLPGSEAQVHPWLHSRLSLLLETKEIKKERQRKGETMKEKRGEPEREG